MLYDISPLLDERLAVWPGDTRFRATDNLRLDRGDTVNLSDVRFSCHTGAHADAPRHVLANGAAIDELELESFVGRCVLRRVEAGGGGLIRPRDLDRLGLDAPVPRLLLDTASRPDRTRFPERFVSLAPELPDRLAELGVRLIGLDSPSVDPFDSEELLAHKALYRHGIVNLENLALAGVPEGEYELIALPLRLAGRDGSPVRAVLRSP